MIIIMGIIFNISTPSLMANVIINKIDIIEITKK